MNLDTPAYGGLVLFDNVTARPAVLAERPEFTNGPTMDRVTWGANASTLFAGNVSAQARELYALTADVSGARIERQVDAASLAGRVQFGAGLVYTDGGVLYDPATLVRIGTLAVPAADAFNSVTIIDGAGNRGFVMWVQMTDGDGFGRYLTSFDLVTRTEIATIPLHPKWHPTKIIRWGTNGLALLATAPFDERVILIEGSFVSP
jgi:hypothetical protein